LGQVVVRGEDLLEVEAEAFAGETGDFGVLGELLAQGGDGGGEVVHLRHWMILEGWGGCIYNYLYMMEFLCKSGYLTVRATLIGFLLL